MKRAFYDFAVSPYSFDFAAFLICAKSQDCDQIVIVPGRREFVAPDGSVVEFQKCSEDEQKYRLSNLILGLAPKAIVCQTRGEAKTLWHPECFPDGYTVDKPVQSHMLGHVMRQKKIMPFMPAKEATEEMQADGWTGEKIVTITIRDTHIKPGRNSRIEEWLKAADWMSSVGLEPVFIPDTENPERTFGAHKVCAKAATDVQYRLAIYEQAYLNLGIANGPPMLNMFSRRPVLMFRPVTPGFNETSEQFWRQNGVPVRSQFPWFSNLQRIIWDGDEDADNIRLQVERWIKAREEGKDEWPLSVAPTYPIYGVVESGGRAVQMAAGLAAAKVNGWPQMKRKAHGVGLMSVVAYGPSLKRTWRAIKRPILTVSGAHDFLIERGIVPDYHMDCDPREHKAQMFLRAHDGVKYRMATVCHPSWWEKLAAQDVEVWHLHNDPTSGEWVKKHDPGANMIGGGSTAGMRALEIGSMLGYRRFELHGFDCSYESDQVRHAGAHSGKLQTIIEVNVDGVWFRSSPQMVEAAKEMITFIQNYDVELTFHGTGLQQSMVAHFLKRFRVLGEPRQADDKREAA